MKSTIRTGIYIALATSLAFSCASTPKTGEQTGTAATQITEELPPPTASELYTQKIQASKLTLLSSSRETTKTKIFTSPYILKAEDSEGKALESFEISVVYPEKRVNGEIVFTETAITTNAEGKAEFLPPPPEYSFNSEISFFPKYEKDSLSEEEAEKIAKIAKENTITAPFKVQTNLKAAGGVIAVVDFNQNGKAITSNPVSSSNLLMTLMKLGFIKIGNAPQDVSDAVIQNNETKIHTRAKAIAQSFIIFGTVKIDSSEKTEAGFSYTLTGEVKAMDAKTGAITFKTEKTLTVTEKNDWNALANARKTLAEQLANEIKYGI